MYKYMDSILLRAVDHSMSVSSYSYSPSGYSPVIGAVLSGYIFGTLYEGGGGGGVFA